MRAVRMLRWQSAFAFSSDVCRVVLAFALGIGFFAGHAAAWGPHSDISAAAIKVLPDAEKWKAALGKDNLQLLIDHKNKAGRHVHGCCWLPDMRGTDFGDFYVDDYLLIRACPTYIGHVMPDVKQTFVPYFRRALQALRTETPTNAVRQIGPILHFVEDAGAPPHAYEHCPHHGELENWVRPEQIHIEGYRPQLLGKTDDEAVAGLLRRMDGLVTFSKARAARALPIVSQPKPDRSKVEPILLESALESSRVAADVLYTLFTLGLEPQPEGANLSGVVTAGAMPGANDHGARIVLLNTDYNTLAVTDQSKTTDAGWHGEFSFRNLPPGRYQILAYRTGSQPQILRPIRLRTGRTTQIAIALQATDPAGNLVENPDGQLSYLKPGTPDRWTRKDKDKTWVSAQIPVKPGVAYSLGAVLKDSETKVSFCFYANSQTFYPKRSDKEEVSLDFKGKLSAETQTTLDKKAKFAYVVVHSTKPLTEAIDHVWLVPASSSPQKPAKK